MDLFNLAKLNKGEHKQKKRVGRGVGSGKGSHTTGRGQKGQKSRTGFNLPTGFEGGQVPLFKKMPHSGGFKNPHRNESFVLNVSDLERFEAGAVITPETIIDRGLVKELPRGGLKILGNGTLTKKFSLEGFIYSKSAEQKIKAAGGSVK